jgi:hypothetical protein
MKKITLATTGSILALVMFASPLVSLANESKFGLGLDNKENEVKVEHTLKTGKENKSEKRDYSWFRAMFARFLAEEQNAPVISNLSATAKNSHVAEIKWVTDVHSNSTVWYGTSSSLSTSGKGDIQRVPRLFNHKIVLNKLAPDTKYYVVVGSENKEGLTKSSEISFTTPKAEDDADDADEN